MPFVICLPRKFIIIYTRIISCKRQIFVRVFVFIYFGFDKERRYVKTSQETFETIHQMYLLFIIQRKFSNFYQNHLADLHAFCSYHLAEQRTYDKTIPLPKSTQLLLLI